MGAMKELLLEAEYVFTGKDKIWERLEEVSGREFRGGATLDLGLLVYAFAGGRWSWMETQEGTHLYTAFYVGGEGVSGDSPIICECCAVDLAYALWMTSDFEGGWVTTSAPKEVRIKPLKLPVSVEPLKHCPCGNVLFGLVSKYELMEEFKSGEMPLEVLCDFMRELTYAYQDAGGFELRTLEPYFLTGDEGNGWTI